MVAEVNRLWQVIRQKTLKQVFLISWTSGNMVKLELGAGGLSFTMQMNSLIKSFQILQRSSSPCRGQNQAGRWANLKEWVRTLATPLTSSVTQTPKSSVHLRASCCQGVITGPSPEGCPARAVLTTGSRVMAKWMFSQQLWGRAHSSCSNSGSLLGAWQMPCLWGDTPCHSKYFLHQSAGGWPRKPQHWLCAPITWPRHPFSSLSASHPPSGLNPKFHSQPCGAPTVSLSFQADPLPTCTLLPIYSGEKIANSFLIGNRAQQNWRKYVSAWHTVTCGVQTDKPTSNTVC